MLDLGLAGVLVFILPAYMFWRSIGRRGKPPEHRSRQYLRSMLIATLLVSTLAFQWRCTGRAFSSLGLAAPVSTAALIELGVGLCILIGLGATMISRPRSSQREAQADPSYEIMPQTRTEMILFVAFALVIGCSWEILYRGYLLWFLPARVGLPMSVALATVAYGLAHGFRSVKMLVGSLVSALTFTAAFALTRSLWWLMLVHCGLPLLGAVAFRRQGA